MLLKIGDMIRIRYDIKTETKYAMRHNSSITNQWVQRGAIGDALGMAAPGELVTISAYEHDQYYVNEDRFWLYTDDMFDPEMLEFLIEDRK